jgi:outer membrane protein OmpA-like peptidoglycan-associated protein
MNKHPLLSMTLLALAALAGCSSLPANNAALDEAHSDFRIAQSNPQAAELASGELKQATDALNKADEAWNRQAPSTEVNHLAYLAKQRVAIAQETAKQKSADLAVAHADATRDKVRLAARTDEADAATRNVAIAQSQAQVAQQQTADVLARNSQLEAQLKDMNARKTERGMVITIGDVLFETGQSRLNPGGVHSLDKLASFLQQFPQRKALVEGYTDSTGGEAFNQTLSGERAQAVHAALVKMGVAPDRITARGYGEAYPTADNGSRGGRQLNRRVEIVLSDDNGNVSAR